ncbi:MAG: alpha-ketoglutarate-dependent dioxygenase AlkB [Prolixibacteraceae bacterium]|jgi:alkylated DNA repair dioxygenase AlkB
MDLFSSLIDSGANLLPKDGMVNYFGPILTIQEANHYFDRLMSSIAWKNDEAIILGKHIVTARKVAWYADREYTYTYSNTTRQAYIWTKDLLELKNLVEKKLGETFNACLLNLYHSGEEGVSWHSDGEKDLKRHGAIASLSLGAERKFCFKHKRTKEKVDLILEHGSLLVMKGTTQTHWLHCLPKTKMIRQPRINLTFRTMVD